MVSSLQMTLTFFRGLAVVAAKKNKTMNAGHEDWTPGCWKCSFKRQEVAVRRGSLGASGKPFPTPGTHQKARFLFKMHYGSLMQGSKTHRVDVPNMINFKFTGFHVCIYIYVHMYIYICIYVYGYIYIDK